MRMLEQEVVWLGPAATDLSLLYCHLNGCPILGEEGSVNELQMHSSGHLILQSVFVWC